MGLLVEEISVEKVSNSTSVEFTVPIITIKVQFLYPVFGKGNTSCGYKNNSKLILLKKAASANLLTSYNTEFSIIIFIPSQN